MNWSLQLMRNLKVLILLVISNATWRRSRAGSSLQLPSATRTKLVKSPARLTNLPKKLQREKKNQEQRVTGKNYHPKMSKGCLLDVEVGSSPIIPSSHVKSEQLRSYAVHAAVMWFPPPTSANTEDYNSSSNDNNNAPIFLRRAKASNELTSSHKFSAPTAIIRSFFSRQARKGQAVMMTN